MNKFSTVIIHNLWWLIPIIFTLIFWNHALPIILILIFSYLGRIILNPLAKLLEKWGFNRKLAIYIIILIIVLIFVILSSSLFPFIWNQVVHLQTSLTLENMGKLQDRILIILENLLPHFIYIFIANTISDSEVFNIWLTNIDFTKSFIGKAGNIAFSLGSSLFSLLLLIVFTIFFLIEGEKFKRLFLDSIPKDKYNMIKNMLKKITIQIHSYIRGQLLASSVVSITSIIGLFILQWITGIKIPYTIIIGIFAGLCNLIPFIGPIMGMIPAITIYLISEQIIPINIIFVFLIILVFAIVQLIDNLIVSPQVMGSSIGIHPMLVIIIVLLGSSIGGILGMLFAIPITAVLKVIIQELMTTFDKTSTS